MILYVGEVQTLNARLIHFKNEILTTKLFDKKIFINYGVQVRQIL
jgi:hypothetical protein